MCLRLAKDVHICSPSLSCQADLFIGIVKHKDRVHLLVDLKTLLTPEEKARVQSVDVSLDEVVERVEG